MLGLQERVALAWLVPLRLYIGWFFLDSGWGKWSSGWIDKGVLAQRIGTWMQEGKTFAFYADFLREQVLTHLSLYSWLVVVGELGAGAALMLGLGTRLAAAAALLMNVNFFLGSAQPLNVVFALCNVVFIAAGAGRTFGLDALVRQRLPKWFIG
jgi:thiosulfate dehydrogenase [quinone] large subunit